LRPEGPKFEAESEGEVLGEGAASRSPPVRRPGDSPVGKRCKLAHPVGFGAEPQ